MKDLGIKNIITGIFVVAAVFALMVFSGVVKLGGNEDVASGTVTVWGTISNQTFRKYIDQAKEKNLNINYIEKKPATFETDLINAFASGTGPDLFIMSHEGILRHGDKVFEIPYASLPRDVYESTYIDEARLFLTDTGSIAFPMTVDPLVMYFNKPLIASSFILDIPEYWDELGDFAPQVTQFTGTGEVSIAAASLGTYDNIPHAKAILSTLILQNGVNIVGENTVSGKKQSTLSLDDVNVERTSQALNFYTSFANFGTNTYSWNEALIDAQNKFIAGEVALYFGRASEVENIRRKNPNLDFGVQLMPQVRESTNRLTQGSMTGIAINKQSKNVSASIAVASKLTSSSITENLSKELLVAPAQKSVLRNKPGDDAFRTLVFNSAIISAGWIDTDPERTDDLFKTMIRNVNTGAQSTNDAINRATADLNTILDQTINKGR